MPTGDFPHYYNYPSDYPSSFTLQSTAPLLGVCSTSPNTWMPSVTTGGTTTITMPNTGGYPTTAYPTVVNTPYPSGGMIWASTSSYPFTIPEWTHRIWFNEHWTYYMQTSNEAEDILMNKRKIKQSCLLS